MSLTSECKLSRGPLPELTLYANTPDLSSSSQKDHPLQQESPSSSSPSSSSRCPSVSSHKSSRELLDEKRGAGAKQGPWGQSAEQAGCGLLAATPPLGVVKEEVVVLVVLVPLALPRR